MKGKKKEIRTREASGHSTIGKHKFQKEAFKIQLKDYSILDIYSENLLCLDKENIPLQCQYTA